MRMAVAVCWASITITVAPRSPKPDHEEPGDPAGADGHPQGRRQRAVPGCGGRAHVAPHRRAHADEAGQARESGAHQERQGPEDARGHEAEHGVVGCRVDDLGRGHEHEDGHGDDDQADRLVLAPQVGDGALLDGVGDLAHRRRALVGRQHLAHQQQRRQIAT